MVTVRDKNGVLGDDLADPWAAWLLQYKFTTGDLATIALT